MQLERQQCVFVIQSQVDSSKFRCPSSEPLQKESICFSNRLFVCNHEINTSIKGPILCKIHCLFTMGRGPHSHSVHSKKYVNETSCESQETHVNTTCERRHLCDGVFVAQLSIWSRTHVHVWWEVVTLDLDCWPVDHVEVQTPEDRRTLAYTHTTQHFRLILLGTRVNCHTWPSSRKSVCALHLGHVTLVCGTFWLPVATGPGRRSQLTDRWGGPDLWSDNIGLHLTTDGLSVVSMVTDGVCGCRIYYISNLRTDWSMKWDIVQFETCQLTGSW